MRHRREGIVLGLIALSSPLGLNMYVPAFPAMAHDLGATPVMIQFSLVSFLIALALGQNIFGPLSDRLGRRGSLLAGLGLFSLASIGAGLSPTADHLVAWRFAQGLGACATIVVPRAIIRDVHTGPAAARLMSLMILVMSMGPLMAPVAGTAFTKMFGWQSIFWFLTGTGLSSLFLVFFLLPESLPPARRVSIARALLGYKNLLHSREFLCIAMMIGFAQGIYFAYLSGSPFVFMRLFGLKEWQFGLLFAVTALSFAVPAQSAAWLMDRLSPNQILSAAIVLNSTAALAALAMTLSGVLSLPLLVASIILLFSTIGILMSAGTVIALHPHPKEAGSASALIGTIGFASGALSSSAVAFGEDGSVMPMVATMAGCALLSAAAMVLRKRGPREYADIRGAD